MQKLFYRLEDCSPESTPIELLGGKGFNLARMKNLGLRVPPAVIIPTSVCVAYQANPAQVMGQIAEGLAQIQAYLSESFGYMPLVSVRSGAKVSMPGMMDTILNVGLCDANAPEWVARLNDSCVSDSYSRLKHMYADVVGLELPQAVDAQLLGAIEAVFRSWNNERAITYRDLNGRSF